MPASYPCYEMLGRRPWGRGWRVECPLHGLRLLSIELSRVIERVRRDVLRRALPTERFGDTALVACKSAVNLDLGQGRLATIGADVGELGFEEDQLGFQTGARLAIIRRVSVTRQRRRNATIAAYTSTPNAAQSER